ncbi:hypothetical protein MBRA1_001590 [Malassezia brasiliensis]|uniref:CCD97-like C-terminal domain-containing protein n=1 Tax=Malassezia brasiliensis TaxID=1821822 RepID=A0AAF0INF8_9BASI|nr:hypothetical protein MBRA1_001590 [Malassezia brasiliensis]
MAPVRGWHEVEAWLAAAHPDDTDHDAAHVFSAYFAELPMPLGRIVGELLSPTLRGAHPIVRERRRRFAATQPEELSIARQRELEPTRWQRTVGTGQEEEVEEIDLDMELELRHDAEREREQEHEHEQDAAPQSPEAAQAEVASRTAPAEDTYRPSDLPAASAHAHLNGLHRKYLDAIDADSLDEGYDSALLAEFQQATIARFVRGVLPVSYACDYDERWDAHTLDQDNERMREDAWFDDE